MLRLAQFVLRGPLYAGGIAAASMAVPFLFWLGAAVVALVTLRLGPKEGLNIGIWALFPAAAWFILGWDPAPLSVLLVAVVMAIVLQKTVAWDRTLLAGAVAAAVVGQAVPVLSPAFMNELVETGTRVYQEMNPEMAEELGEGLEQTVRTMMIGSIAALNYVLAFASMLLARGWQARLFNPGGLQSEFHEFRVTGPVGLGCVMVMAFGTYVGVNPAIALLVFGLPLVFAGLALVHGLVALRGMSKAWLVGLYVALVLLGPTLLFLLVFMAILDSWLDIRKRITSA